MTMTWLQLQSEIQICDFTSLGNLRGPQDHGSKLLTS